MHQVRAAPSTHHPVLTEWLTPASPISMLLRILFPNLRTHFRGLVHPAAGQETHVNIEIGGAGANNYKPTLHILTSKTSLQRAISKSQLANSFPSPEVLPGIVFPPCSLLRLAFFSYLAGYRSEYMLYLNALAVEVGVLLSVCSVL